MVINGSLFLGKNLYLYRSAFKSAARRHVATKSNLSTPLGNVRRFLCGVSGVSPDAFKVSVFTNDYKCWIRVNKYRHSNLKAIIVIHWSLFFDVTSVFIPKRNHVRLKIHNSFCCKIEKAIKFKGVGDAINKAFLILIAFLVFKFIVHFRFSMFSSIDSYRVHQLHMSCRIQLPNDRLQSRWWVRLLWTVPNQGSLLDRRW